MNRDRSQTRLPPPDPAEPVKEKAAGELDPRKPSRAAFPCFRVALGLFGLVFLVFLVRRVGVDAIVTILRSALRWLPLLCALEFARICCAAVASYLGFGRLAGLIPKATLLRAHILGHSLGGVAPAPSVVNETIKATLLSPHVGVGPAAAVGVINQSATLISVGGISVFCGIAIYAIQGFSLWFWACAVHAVVLVGCGLGLQAVTRAGAFGRFIVAKVPRLSARAEAFRTHARETKLGALGPTSALLVGRSIQVLQYAIGARAVGIDVSLVRALAAQGVNLVAVAVGVLVPAGLGTTDGAFTLAADLLGTTVTRATSLALLMRCNQLIWVLIGSVVALGGRGRRAT